MRFPNSMILAEPLNRNSVNLMNVNLLNLLNLMNLMNLLIDVGENNAS
jgi:hypothetical protein